ncbi:MAG: response regulator [Rhodocyclaceae bacterium]|nr:response regulator [Rhodocyclaceae bacterium]
MKRLSLTVEQSPAAIVITDRSGVIEYANPAFEAECGYSLAELSGQNVRMLCAGKTPRAVFDDLWAALDAGRVWRGEFRNRRKDGSEYDVASTVSPLRDEDGSARRFVAIQEDVTEKNRLRAELARYQGELETLVASRTADLASALDAAEAASRAKSTFLANMSHEIRTPLNAIIGLTHLLRKRIAEPQSRDWLDKIETAGEHLLALINDVLDMAKIESGKFALTEERFTLPALLEEVRALMTSPALQKGLSLEIDAPGLDSALIGDRLRLRQALTNYLGNAFKFTAHGRVKLRVRCEEEDEQSIRLRFEVEDTGSGIAPEVLARLFTPFEQGDTTATRPHGGTGLGLALVKHFARLMDGEAGAHSTPGVGSTFWFTARLKRAAAPAPTASSLSPTARLAALAGRRILLAEDEPINRAVLVELLADSGLIVEVASNGAEAVRRAGEGGFDLILMDVQMPVMDGLAATQAIRRTPGGARLPIIALTANAFVEDRQHCFAAGMSDFLTKPIDPDKLYACLADWLERTQG